MSQMSAYCLTHYEMWVGYSYTYHRINDQGGTRLLMGEFIATDKNAIVRDLYARLGFRRVVSSAPGDRRDAPSRRNLSRSVRLFGDRG